MMDIRTHQKRASDISFAQLLKVLGSLQLTVICLVFAMLLVFLSTLEQVHLGIHEVQSRYFGTWLAFVPLPRPIDAPAWLSVFKIPLLGGYTLGIILLVNLLAASPRILSFRKLGLMFIHGGLITLIISGFISALFQEETQLWVLKDSTTHYSESTYENELVFIDTHLPEHDTVYAIPASHLKEGRTFKFDQLPFAFHVKAFYENAAIGQQANNPQLPPSLATQGSGSKMGLTAISLPPTYKEEERNATTAYIQILSLDGEDLGTWLVSNILDDRFPPQQFTFEGQNYNLALRFKRSYLPLSFRLTEFVHETHPGTDIPKNFSSQLRISEKGYPDRTITIRMNEPLRSHGYTFYQASFKPGEQASMLQVVKNPGWTGPYIGVLLIALGMSFHFGQHLLRFLKSKRP